MNRKNFFKIVAFSLIIILISSISEGREKKKIKSNAAEVEEKPSIQRRAAWAVFGECYYNPDHKYPIAEKPFFYEKISTLTLPIESNSPKNKGADETGWVPIPVNAGKVYYRAEYHLKNLNIPLDKWIDQNLQYYKDHKLPKQYSNRERQKILEKGKIQIILFPQADFFLRYHPGTNLLLKENGDKNGARLNGPRAGVKIEPIYTGIPGQDFPSLIGVFNGTFHNDNSKWRVRNKLVRPGLIIEDKVVDEPLDDMASIAVYSDSTFCIDEYNDLPEKEFSTLRQNNFLVLDGGQLDEKGAYPFGWRDADNEVLRSYLFTTHDQKYFGYVWTNFCPPSVIAQIMQMIGAQQMMLLDINPVISAIFSSPNTTGKNIPFSKKTSYHFVPFEGEVVNSFLLALAKKVNGSLQQDQYEVFYGNLAHDFFSVYLR